MSSSSTGHFPGAPINTEPITTMATSSSQPVTTPSCASSLPFPSVFPSLGSPVAGPSSQPEGDSTQPGPPSDQPAPSSNQPAPSSNQPAPLSNQPEPSSAAPASGEAAPEASSSGAEQADKEAGKEAEAAEPAISEPSSSGDATSTTNTTTTASSGTTGANTTTTNATTTTVTGKVSPARPTQNSFQDAIAKCNNCLFLIRKLRAKQDKISYMFLTNELEQGFPLEKCRDFNVMLQSAIALYDKLDHWARRLPRVVPPIDNINVMRTLYIQEHTMDHTNINHLVEKMIDAGNWNEGNFQVFYFLTELLRVPTHHQNLIFSITDDWDKKDLVEMIFASSQIEAHKKFDDAYQDMRKEIMSKSLGIYPRTLHCTNTSLVVEFLFGYGGAAKKEATEHDVLHTIKILVVEKCGSIEFINIMPPTEPWVLMNNFGRTEVDPFATSRYEVYRRLTRTANLNLQHFFGSNPEQARTTTRWSANTLLLFVSMFGKIRDVFTARCRICKRHLRHHLPPTSFDLRSPTICVHETCRFNIHLFRNTTMTLF